MKKTVLLLSILIGLTVNAGEIIYGYNAEGDYAPISINGEFINYSYNANGDYVPTSIGDRNIQYGYNANGDFAAISIDDDDDFRHHEFSTHSRLDF